MSEPLVLRDYQAAGNEAVREKIREGHKRIIICGPTGSGKTEQGIDIMQNAAAKSSRTAFICDRVALINQTGKRLDDHGIEHGVIQAGHWRWRPYERIQVCSAQTLARRGISEDLKLIIVDEAHTFYRTTTKFILAHPDIVTIGLTATPFNKSLGTIYTAVVNVTTTNKLLAAGHLAPLKIFVCRAIDTKGLHLKFNGEWNEDEVSKRTLAIVGDVVGEWTKKTNEIFGGPVKTIIFSDSVASGAELVKQFNAQGHNFVQLSYLDGNDAMTQEIIEEYRKPDTNITGLISVEKLAKGFDVPDIQCVVLMKPYRKSLSGVIQQIGRGMRSSPGKEFCLLLDHSGNIDRFSEDISEFFENGVSKLDDSNLDDKVRKEPEEAEREARNCQSCGYTPITRTMTECPHCHVEIKRRVALHVPGEMHELTLGPNGRKLEHWLQDKEAVARQIWYIALERKKGDHEAAVRFAKAQYRNLFGTWTPRRIDSYTPQEPHPLLVQRIRANLIRWAHSRNNPANAKGEGR